MAKRVGANRRKARAERTSRIRKKAPGLFKRLMVAGRFGVIAAIAGVGAVVGARKAIAWVNTSDHFLLKNVHVRGVDQLDSMQVLSLAAVEQGVRLSEVHVREIAERVRKAAVVADVEVRRRLPDAVVISVVEREPIAMINTGRVSLVDAEGVLLPLQPSRYLNVPVITGLRDTVLEDGRTCLAPEDLVRMKSFFVAARSVDRDLVRGISQVEFLKDSRIRFRLESSSTTVDVNGREVVGGIAKLARILRSLRGGMGKMPRKINLCYSNLAYVIH